MSCPRRSRPATAEDVARDGHRFAWLKPDGWREGFRALVLEIEEGGDGTWRVIGVGRIGASTVHPRRDLVELEIDPAHRRQGHGTALLRELGRYSNNPLSSKVAPGSERDLFLRSLGAVTYLPVPLLSVHAAAERTERWCAAVCEAADGDVQLVRLGELPRADVADALADRYHWQHASWSPTASRDVLVSEVGASIVENSVLELSWATLREGRITALLDVYDEPVGPVREACVEAVDASEPTARLDVALCLAAALEGLCDLGVTHLDLDNHPTDPHAAPLLATLDPVEKDPVHLVEIPNGLTSRLRDLG
ncbi:GNAT family N-acetyltransferase [Brachybacterium sp. YJGR34]|uniref:GNAT family N-acetyltransferase n=1 Tax=Brachybacterium sp. YJGR34 TaxID=2059911 RepID=UPI000E0B9A5B|nr:GNAT family N-acetyltransferase [Brachybacterium sp. YJGR34]